MCTAATYQTKDFYFGRNLDYEFPYGEEVCIVPRSFPIPLRHLPALQTHYAMIGMAHVEDGFPLFYDAVNETGLCIAGLNFVGNAAYAEPTDGKTNVAQFELIEWLLGTCRNLEQARRALAGCNLVGTPFSGKLPTAQLHWLIADETGSIVLESTQDGLHIYENRFRCSCSRSTITRSSRPARRSTAFPKTFRSGNTRGAWAQSVCRAICRRSRASSARRSRGSTPNQMTRRKPLSASFSTS